MPQMCEYFLRQQAAAHPEATEALISVLRLGVAAKLASATPEQKAATAVLAARVSHLSLELAHWAVDSWCQALAGAKPSSPPPRPSFSPLDASPPAGSGRCSYRRAVLHLLVVTLAGAAGAALPGIQIGLALPQFATLGRLGALTPEWIEGWNGMQIALLYGGIGLVSGALGGGLGWMFGGGLSSTYLLHGGTTLGRLSGAMLGSFLLARLGAVVGLFLGGPGGLFFGGLAGSAGGAWLGYLLGAFTFLFLLLCIFR